VFQVSVSDTSIPLCCAYGNFIIMGFTLTVASRLKNVFALSRSYPINATKNAPIT
jgi:hypothetical protein